MVVDYKILSCQDGHLCSFSVCVCVCVCARACVRACVCVCVCACVRVKLLFLGNQRQVMRYYEDGGRLIPLPTTPNLPFPSHALSLSLSPPLCDAAAPVVSPVSSKQQSWRQWSNRSLWIEVRRSELCNFWHQMCSVCLVFFPHALKTSTRNWQPEADPGVCVRLGFPTDCL